MKTIEEWTDDIWFMLGADAWSDYPNHGELENKVKAIRNEAFDAAIEAIDKCTFRGKDNRLRPTITFADAIKAIQELKEKK